MGEGDIKSSSTTESSFSMNVYNSALDNLDFVEWTCDQG